MSTCQKEFGVFVQFVLNVFHPWTFFTSLTSQSSYIHQFDIPSKENYLRVHKDFEEVICQWSWMYFRILKALTVYTGYVTRTC